MNITNMEEFFSEPNKFGYRTLKPGKSSSLTVREFQKNELIEFISELFECDTKRALTAYFNGRFVRCSVCAAPITNSYSSASCTIKCGRQMSLKHLRESGKIENLRRKCSEITSRWWSEMSPERYEEICTVIGNRTREYFDSLTDEEKQRWNTNPSGFKESLENFYAGLTREQHLEMRRAIGKRMRKIDYEKLGEYALYHHKVWEITRETYRKNKEKINPDDLKRGKLVGEYQLDHKYSISMGFKTGVPPEIIGSLVNLEMLSTSENASKNWRCSISKEQLMESYNVLR